MGVLRISLCNLSFAGYSTDMITEIGNKTTKSSKVLGFVILVYSFRSNSNLSFIQALRIKEGLRSLHRLMASSTCFLLLDVLTRS